jgi:hypothetical protein
VQALAREHTTATIQTLVAALKNPRHKVAPAMALLDRGWGKPLQTVHTEGQTLIALLHLVAARSLGEQLQVELGVMPAAASAEPPLTIDALAALPPPTE